MKKKLTFLSLCLALFLVTGQSQVIYVSGSASGNNDGTSWVDAYVDLDVALQSATSGQQIWVQSGTYKPGGGSPSRSSSFSIGSGVELYGGFAGNESSLDERDIVSNPTVLSGDVNDDDVTGDFTNFRSDNCRHLIIVPDGVDNTTRIDGFVMSHGQTDDVNGSGDDRRGGAILCYGAPVIANCTFTENYGYYAGAVYPRGSGSSGTMIVNCQFNDNLSGYGGGIYIISNENVVIRDCSFENNNCQNRGGAVYNGGGSTVFEDCVFENNIAVSSGAIYHNTIDDPETASVVFRRCDYRGNRGNFGGAMSIYGNGTSLVEDCIFDGNTADAGGGALSIGFTNNSMIINTHFANNQADRGGAIWQQNDTTSVTIEDCYFETNLCLTSNGGAIFQRGSAQLRVYDSQFEGNRAEFGGAIYMTEDSVDLSSMVLERCYFNFNVAESQGGAININNADCYLASNLISNSIINAGQVGGAISTNASGGGNTEIVLVNNTMYGNVALIGAGIAQWTDSDTSGLTLFSQNNIYANAGTNYEIEAGSPNFESRGGNLSTDNSLSAIANLGNDFHLTQPLMIDPIADDFRLQEGSPCINSGTEDDAPDTDIDGNPRVGQPDIGAYEYQSEVATNDIDPSVNVSVFPNPSVEEALVEWRSSRFGKSMIDVFDSNGRLIFTRILNKSSEIGQTELQVASWPSGKYHVVVYEENVRYVGQLIKY